MSGWPFDEETRRLQEIPAFLDRREEATVAKRRKLVERAGDGHSRLAPSAAKRWINCPGSVRLAARFPDAGSEEARYGTALHDVAARCLRDGGDAWEHAGCSVEVEGRSYEVDDEAVDCVQAYLDAVRADLAADGVDPSELLVERRVGLEGTHPDVWGTADAAYVAPAAGLLRVYDLKTGVGVAVEPEGNEQQSIYGAALAYELSATYDLREVEIVVVQPRAPHPGGFVRRWRTTVDDLGRWVSEVLEPAARRTDEEDAPLRPHPDWCRFCPAKVGCPALDELVMEGSMNVNDDNVDLSPLEDWEIGERLEKANVVRQYARALEDEAYARLLRGRELPGVKLVRKQSSRVWKEDAEEVLKTEYGDAAYETRLRTPPQVEKLRGGRKIVAEHAYKPDGGLTVALAGDKRPAVTSPSPDEAFADVEV